MSAWIFLWKTVCLVGLASFALMVVGIAYQGTRDILFLFRELRHAPDGSDGDAAARDAEDPKA